MTDFSTASLGIDAAAETDRIAEGIRGYLRQNRRRGTVVAVSGGIDSSVVAALCVHALGPERVLALQLPESESSDETVPLSSELIASLGVDSRLEDISPHSRPWAATDDATTPCGASSATTVPDTGRRSSCPAWWTPTGTGSIPS